MQQYFFSSSVTPLIILKGQVYLPFRQLKNSKKEGTKTEKKEILGEINQIKAGNIPLCPNSEGEAKIRKLKINQKNVF